MKTLLIALAFALAASAAEPLKLLTLERAISIAIENHPQLAEAHANIESANAAAAAAGKFPNPEAIARIESAPFSSATSRAEYVAGVSQALPLGGRLSAARRAEQAGAATRSHELELARREVARTVRNAFATALFASQVFETHTNNAAALSELVRISKARLDAGDIAPAELARIESEEAQHRLELHESTRLHHAALDGLATAIGDYRVHIEPLSGSLEDTLQLAAIKSEAFGGDHPAIATAESQVKAREARLKLARSERIPDVNVDLLYRRIESSRENAFDFGIRIPIPLFDRKSRVRQAQHELRAAEARYDNVRNQIGHEQHELELQLRSALAAVELFKTDVLPKTGKALAAAEARFNAGDISLAELLPIRREHHAARLRYSEAIRVVLVSWAGLLPARDNPPN